MIRQFRRPRVKWIDCALLAAIYLLFSPSLLTAQSPTSRPDAWKQDLSSLAVNLPRLHKKFFFQLSRSDFDRAVAELDQSISSLSDQEIIVRLAGIAAMAGDAHTSISLAQPPISFRTFPIQFQWFSDGAVVIAASAEYRRALGCRLVRIGNAGIEEAFQAVAKIIPHENHSWAREVSRGHLLIPEVLYTLRILPGWDSGEFEFEDPNGTRFSLTLEPVPRGSAISWVVWPESQDVATPLYLKDPNLNYWYRYLGEARTLYFKYNICREATNLRLSDLADRALAVIDTNTADTVVIDLRHNSGGDSSIIAPFTSGLQERVNQRRIEASRIYTLIGPKTFSSGMLNAVQLYKMGSTILGEPTGGKPNSYGELQSFTLPNSGLVVGYSVKEFQLLPGTDTPSLMPHVLVQVSSTEYSHGRDPVLEEVLRDRPESTRIAPFALYRDGGTSLETTFGPPDVTVGSGQVHSIGNTPSGLAIFGYRPDGVLVTEASVPATVPVQTGRLYAESAAGYRTGLAISNPNASGVTLSFHFTDRNGQDFGHGTLALPAHGQIARFLNEDPFRLAASEETTFAFEASAPVAVLGLRGRDNERGEFLITTLPLSPEIAQPGQELYLPHFTYGGGWTTQVVLVNPGGRPVTGNLVFFDQGRADTPANPVSVLLNGAAGSSFRYELPPGATRTFSTSGEPKDLVVGSIRILPDPESATPRAMAVFSFRQNGITVTEAGVEAVIPGKSRTMYAEASGDFSSLTGNATTTGIAVANASDRLMTVQFRLRDFRGIDQRLGAIVLPARGQAALFMHQIPGLDQIETPFRGTIEITADSPYAAMTGLRGRRNERGDFLITSTPLFEKELSSFVRVFPHIADGGGYRTQLILLDWLSASAGSILFSDQSGAAWSVGIR